ADVGEDLRGEEPAVLVAALVRLALDVQHDPAGLRVAVGGAVALHRARVRLEVLRGEAGGPRRGGQQPGKEDDPQAARRNPHGKTLAGGDEVRCTERAPCYCGGVALRRQSEREAIPREKSRQQRFWKILQEWA